MRELHLRAALTTARHFAEAGYDRCRRTIHTRYRGPLGSRERDFPPLRGKCNSRATHAGLRERTISRTRFD